MLYPGRGGGQLEIPERSRHQHSKALKRQIAELRVMAESVHSAQREAGMVAK